MAPVLVTLNDLEGHSPVAVLLKCSPSNICAVFYPISTDSALVMHIGHELPTVYTMSDGNNTTQLETIPVEKDLDVHIANDLKQTEQCIQAAKKAQSVLGMINRQLKIIDKEDFGIIYKTCLLYTSDAADE